MGASSARPPAVKTFLIFQPLVLFSSFLLFVWVLSFLCHSKSPETDLPELPWFYVLVLIHSELQADTLDAFSVAILRGLTCVLTLFTKQIRDNNRIPVLSRKCTGLRRESVATHAGSCVSVLIPRELLRPSRLRHRSSLGPDAVNSLSYHPARWKTNNLSHLS